MSFVCDALMPLKPGLSDRAQLLWLRGINVATGLAAVCLTFVVPDVFEILVLAYSFWSPLILVPLAAALLGVKSNGRAFRYALLAGWSPPSCGIMDLGNPGDLKGLSSVPYAISWCLRGVHGPIAATVPRPCGYGKPGKP